MDGIIIINKEKGITSRGVVNELCKILNTKKIGHTGTLDPFATGVLVVCIGKALKLVELLTGCDKTYTCKAILGYETDTLDTEGTIIKENNKIVSSKEIEGIINNFPKTYSQEVPIYSAVKVNGKRLYEYARNNIKVDLPKREVNIYNIELLGNPKEEEFTFTCTVSSGTYIRSLVRDIAYKLDTYGYIKSLERTRVGKFNIKDSYTLEDVKKGNYKIIPIHEVLDIPKLEVSKELLFKLKNGQVVPKFFEEDMALIMDNGKEVCIYKTSSKDKTKKEVYKMF